MPDETPELLPPPPDAVADVPSDLVVVRRPPAVVLAEAREAATAVAEAIKANPHKVVLNGRQYMQFPDWQVIGRFYGVSAKVISTEYFADGEFRGFVARAVAVRADGLEISAAEASCATDEPKWVNKPQFQLRSMAQTRAAAKCLRNVLSFVPVLAGFSDTPAEEMIDDGDRAVSRRAPTHPRDTTSASITDKQWKRLAAIRNEAGWSKDDVRAYLHETYGLDDMHALTRPQYDELCAHVQQSPRTAQGEDMLF
jgi:hypothetical protein